MSPYHSPLEQLDSSGGGWVGVADSLIGGLVLFLVVALAAASQLNTANTQLTAAQTQLAEKSKRVDEVENELLAVKRKASELQNEQQKVVALLKSLEEEREKLKKKESDFITQLSKLERRLKVAEVESTEARASVVRLTKAFDELKKAENGLKLQIDKLKSKADIIDIIVKDFDISEKEIIIKIRQIKASCKELVELRTRQKVLDKILELLRTKDNEVLAKLESLKTEWESAKIQWDKEIKLDRKLYSDLVQKAKELEELRESLKRRPKAEAVHAKLLSIKGSLKKVVIILDFSGSMIMSRGSGQKNRWAIAKEYIDDVCKYLDMEECVLIVFSNDAKVYGRNNTTLNTIPGSPAFEDDKLKRVWSSYDTKRLLREDEKMILFQLGQLTDDDKKTLNELRPFRLGGETNDRDLLNNLVAKLPNPNGATNTMKALNIAFRIEGVTNILLFTDGEPGLLAEQISAVEKTKLEENGMRVKPPDFAYQRDWILKTVDEHKAECEKTGKRFPHINAIGIGNYFDNDLASFLRTLSEEKTGGSFQGR